MDGREERDTCRTGNDGGGDDKHRLHKLIRHAVIRRRHVRPLPAAKNDKYVHYQWRHMAINSKTIDVTCRLNNTR